MAINLGNLKTYVKNYGYGTLEDSRLTEFINRTYRDIVGMHRWSWNLSATTRVLTAATNEITIARNTYEFFGRLAPSDANTPDLTYVSWMNEDPENADFVRAYIPTTLLGYPSRYSIRGDKVLFDYYAQSTITYNHYYWPVATPLSSDSDTTVIPDSDVEVLVLGTLVHTSTRDKDWTGAMQFKAQFNEVVDQMWATDRAETHQANSHVKMPATYSGVFF